MGFDIATAGAEAAQGALGAGLGIIMAKANDKRQLKQQTKLQALQMGGMKEMTDYQKMKELEMWKATNYKPQMDELKKAGLNPGLIYGMSGGGGQTTGGSGQSPAGATATQGGGGEIGMGMQMAAQMQLLKAQKENIEADTDNKRADTANKPITGENIQANTGLTNVKTQIAAIEQSIKAQTLEDSIRTIRAAEEKMIADADQAKMQNNITEATWEAQVEQIKAELTGTYIKNDLLKKNIQVNDQQIEKMKQDIQQGWKQLGINQQNANTQEAQQKLNKWVNDVSEQTKLTVQTVSNIAQSILGKLIPTKHIMKK